MTPAEIAIRRLYNQHLARLRFAQAGEVVRWLGAVQAQDYPASLWAIGLRLPQATVASVEQAVAEGTVVRTWPMRGTIHYVPAEDARWMLKLLTPRVIARSAGRYRQLELEEAMFSRSRQALARALQGGKRLTRPALYRVLEAAGISAAGGRGLHILGRLAQEGLICFGPRQGKQPTFVLLEEWVPASRALEGEEALAELARRYFRSHGPATAQDFAWWSGLSLTEARRGLELVRAEFTHTSLDSAVYWFAEGSPIEEGPPTAHLLPWYDEYLVAYKDRSAVLEPAYARQVNAGGGLLNPTVVIEGRVVGTWKRTLEKKALTLRLELFEKLDEVRRVWVAGAAGRYGRFLSLPVIVEG